MSMYNTSFESKVLRCQYSKVVLVREASCCIPCMLLTSPCNARGTGGGGSPQHPRAQNPDTRNDHRTFWVSEVPSPSLSSQVSFSLVTGPCSVRYLPRVVAAFTPSVLRMTSSRGKRQWSENDEMQYHMDCHFRASRYLPPNMRAYRETARQCLGRRAGGGSRTVGVRRQRLDCHKRSGRCRCRIIGDRGSNSCW